MKRCNSCGCWNNENDQFCYNCNTRIAFTKILTCKECKKPTDVLVDGKCPDCFNKSFDREFTFVE